MEREDSSDVPSTPVLENPEHQTKWYFKFFLGKLHQNYLGLDSSDPANPRAPYVISVLEERSFGTKQYRAILWTRDGPKRLCFRGGKNSRTMGPKQVRLCHNIWLAFV